MKKRGLITTSMLIEVSANTFAPYTSKSPRQTTWALTFTPGAFLILPNFDKPEYKLMLLFFICGLFLFYSISMWFVDFFLQIYSFLLNHTSFYDVSLGQAKVSTLDVLTHSFEWTEATNLQRCSSEPSFELRRRLVDSITSLRATSWYVIKFLSW